MLIPSDRLSNSMEKNSIQWLYSLIITVFGLKSRLKTQEKVVNLYLKVYLHILSEISLHLLYGKAGNEGGEFHLTDRDLIEKPIRRVRKKTRKLI